MNMIRSTAIKFGKDDLGPFSEMERAAPPLTDRFVHQLGFLRVLAGLLSRPL